MPDELATQTPSVSDGLSSEQDGSQAVETPAQAAAAPAQNGTSTQVEGGDTNQTTGNEPRPFERVFGRKLDKLEKGLRALTEIMNQQRQSQAQPAQSQAVPTARQMTQEELMKDPLSAIQQMLDERDKRILGEIPQSLQRQMTELQLKQSYEDGLKLIKTNAAYRKDPLGADRMKDILDEENEDGHTLNEYGSYNPRHAAKLALEIYERRYGKPQAAQPQPTKTQMASTATAVRSGGGTMNLQQEAAEIQRQVMASPELMDDPAFKSKLDDIVKRSKMERAIKQPQ